LAIKHTYIFSLFFLWNTLIFSQDKQPDAVLWQEDLQLHWKDFKGTPKPHIDAVAITASGITFGYSVTRSETEVVDANFTIEAHFYPDHSWCKKGRVNDVVLNHERFHFNITELFARKFRQRIAKAHFTNAIKQEADAIYKAINKELEVMQKHYDKETNYSMDLEQQNYWQLKIEAELKALSKYKFNS